MSWRGMGKAVILALAVCGLAACGTKQEADRGKMPEEGKKTVAAAGIDAGKAPGSVDGDYMADDMSVSSEDDKEFTLIRIKDEYFDIRRRGDYIELHYVYTYGTDYPEMEDGACAHVVADVDIYDGGVAGYMNDYYLKDVKSYYSVPYEDIAIIFELPDAGETNINMYNHMLAYHHAGSCYLFSLIWDKVVAYKDGEFFAEYDLQDIEGPDTPEPFLKDVKENVPEFSENTMFTLRIYEPWFYESLHYTLLNDGTLIVLYYDTELGREKLSDEKMEEIRNFFSPESVYTMDVGKEADRTDGTQRYIILYDSDENEIKVGGYELEGGDDFDGYFHILYHMLEDDYTKQWSDKLDECMQDSTTYGERYLNW